MLKKIVLITCYFGNFPWYFRLFLKSCSYNKTIDFVIFSDCNTNYRLSSNVQIIPFTLEAFNKLATTKLGFEISVKSAYKLCDFKPAYGVIFSEYVVPFDFWGITDIDIVFGRIREFMTDELLETFDVVSVRNDYPTGSFMLFRNNEISNNLFKKSKDYKKVFQSDVHYCFDECNFRHLFLQEGGIIDDLECEVESMHHVIMGEMKKNAIKAHFDFLVIEGLPGQLKWEEGFLSFKNEFEVLLHHLILYKSNAFTRKKAWKKVPKTFYIDKYVIRKSELGSLKGLLVNLYHNKIRPNLYKTLFKIDYFISNSINISIKGLKNGFYKLNDMSFQVLKNNAHEYVISFQENGVGGKIIKSLFYTDAFYIKASPFIRYGIKHKENQIMTLSANGMVRVFDKMN